MTRTANAGPPSHGGGVRARRPLGLTLVELLVALAVLGVVLAIMLAIQADAHRHARRMELRSVAAELVRSEAERLIAGATEGSGCPSLTASLREAGFGCEVSAGCGYGAAWCSAAPALRPYLVRVTDPDGVRHELAVLARAAPMRGVEDPG